MKYFALKPHIHLTVLLAVFVMSSCTSTKVLDGTGFQKSDTDPEMIVSGIPDYSSSLSAAKGMGKAIVSEPGNTERATVYFSSNRRKSLVTVKNGIGIEGGQLLTDGDSLLVYNKIDKYARKISIKDGNLSRINNLASLNILSMLNYPVKADQVKTVKENEKNYLLLLNSGTKVFVDKQSLLIHQVQQSSSSSLPYSQIIYDAYGEIEDLKLPRRITIFSADSTSKVNLLIRELDVNPELGELKIDLPDNIKIYHR